MHIKLKKENEELKRAEVASKSTWVNYTYSSVKGVIWSVKNDKKTQKRRAEGFLNNMMGKFDLLFGQREGLSSKKTLVFAQKPLFDSNFA